jgi:hypothetical protein
MFIYRKKRSKIYKLARFVWLVSHKPTTLFSLGTNQPSATSQQYNKSAPATSQTNRPYGVNSRGHHFNLTHKSTTQQNP